MQFRREAQTPLCNFLVSELYLFIHLFTKHLFLFIFGRIKFFFIEVPLVLFIYLNTHNTSTQNNKTPRKNLKPTLTSLH